MSVVPWKGMSYVDLHCHLLPGLDDGAATMAATLAHARPAGGGRRARRRVHAARQEQRVPAHRPDQPRAAARRGAAADRGPRDRRAAARRRRAGARRRAAARSGRARADRAGPRARALAAARVPVRGHRGRLHRRRRAALGARLRPAARPPGARRAGARRRGDGCSAWSIAARCCRSTPPRCSVATGRGRAPSPSGCSATAWCGAWPPTAIRARATTRSTAASRRSSRAARASAWRRCSRRTTRACCSSRARLRSR